MKRIILTKLLFAVLVLISIITIINVKRKASIYDRKGNIKIIPTVISENINNLDDAVYVQFIESPTDVAFFSNVLENVQSYKIYFVAFVADINMRLDVGTFQNITVISDNYERAKKIFRISNFTMYYIFNKFGSIVDKGPIRMQYLSKIKLVFSQELENRNFSLIHWIPMCHINEISWLNRISYEIDKIKVENDLHHYLFVLLSHLNCSSEQLIKYLLDFYNNYSNKFSITIILKSKFDIQDIANFKTFYRLPFEVIPADEVLDEEWTRMMSIYPEDELTNIVMFIDDSKFIRNIAGPSLAIKWSDFISSIAPHLNEDRNYNE